MMTRSVGHDHNDHKVKARLPPNKRLKAIDDHFFFGNSILMDWAENRNRDRANAHSNDGEFMKTKKAITTSVVGYTVMQPRQKRLPLKVRRCSSNLPQRG